MKIAALFSGGKDSAYAIYIAQQWGWEVTSLVSIIPEHGESYMFHVPNIGLTGELAKCLDIPIFKACTKGVEEKELDDLKELLASMDTEALVTGAIASDYQTSRINMICHDLGIKVFSPLWRKDQKMLLKDMLDAGFRMMIVGVYADGMGKEWLGRIIDEEALADLEKTADRYKINISGEGGEFETLVLDGPNFKKSMKIKDSSINWSGTSGHLEITEVKLH
ncbi:MAG: TIGR00289 family protein [Thermoplasmata archaeon]|nr:TIGR00289 family protein [Thermoplasmata archaeon]